jgi:two-component system OmpR family response regulator
VATLMSASVSEWAPHGRARIDAGVTPEHAPRPRVLVVEDVPGTGGALSSGLRSIGCEVQLATHGQDVTSQEEASPLDAVVLDLAFPSERGFQLLEQVRCNIGTPVLVLVAGAQLSDRLRAFELGASDFVAAPYWVEEVAARIRALVHRPDFPRPSPPLPVVGEVSVDLNAGCVHLPGRKEQLTRTEFAILTLLLRRAGDPVSRRTLLQAARGSASDASLRVVDSHVTRLRKKLGPAANTIVSVWGVGYRFHAAAVPTPG